MNNQRKHIDLDAVTRAAELHGWHNILYALCPDLRDLLDKPRPWRLRVRCPVHGGKDGFNVFKDYERTGGGGCNTCGCKKTGFSLIAWINKAEYMDVVHDVADYLGGEYVKTPVAHAPVNVMDHKSSRDDKTVIRQLDNTWKGTVGIGHAAADTLRRYLINRSLTPVHGAIRDLRCHPSLSFWVDKLNPQKGEFAYIKQGDHPAMVALVRDAAGNPVTLHRTYLTPEGEKLKVLPSMLPPGAMVKDYSAKKQMSHPSYKSMQGCAIRLDDVVTPIINAAEGIENALAARIITRSFKTASFSCLDSGLLSNFDPPEGVRIVCVWSDRDAGAGLKAVECLRGRLNPRGIRVIEVSPNYFAKPGDHKLDWNKVVQRLGVRAVYESEPITTLQLMLEGELKAMGATIDWQAVQQRAVSLRGNQRVSAEPGASSRKAGSR